MAPRAVNRAIERVSRAAKRSISRKDVGELKALTVSGECCASCKTTLSKAYAETTKGDTGYIDLYEKLSDLESSANNGCNFCQLLLCAIAYSSSEALDPDSPVSIWLDIGPGLGYLRDTLRVYASYRFIDIPIQSRERAEGEPQRTASMSFDSFPSFADVPPSDLSDDEPDSQDELEHHEDEISDSPNRLSSSSSSEAATTEPKLNSNDPQEHREGSESNSGGPENSTRGSVQIAQEDKEKSVLEQDDESQDCSVGKALADVSTSIIYNPRENIHELVEIAKTCLSNCTCEQAASSIPNTQESLLPTRVIDVGNNVASEDHSQADLDLKLYVPQPGETGRYVTLSYCWGTTPNTARTTSGRLEPFRQKIPWDILPLTIQDAVVFVRHLGIQYLWVDALCIIQADVVGGPSPDFEREAVRLSDYYGNAVCTLAAASATDSSQGLFSIRTGGRYTPSPCTLHTTHTNPEWQRDVLVNVPSATFKENIMQSTLLERGWVTQEIEFSRRIIFFGRNCLAWKCRQWWRFEDGSTSQIDLKHRAQGCRHCDDVYRTDIGELMQLMLNPYQPDDDHDHDHGTPRGMRWLKFVEQYTKTQFSQPKDRLIALASLASKLSSADQAASLVGGIWKDHFLQGLTWFLESDEFDPKKAQIPAPSWSWASTTGNVHYIPELGVHKTYSSLSKIIPVPSQAYMPGAGGILQMRGLVGKLDFLRHSARRWGYFKKWRPVGSTTLTHARCWRSKISAYKYFTPDIHYHGPWNPGWLILDTMHPRRFLLGDVPGPFICLVLYTHRNFVVKRAARELAAGREDAICLLLEKTQPKADLVGSLANQPGVSFYRRVGIVELQCFEPGDLTSADERDVCIV